VDSYQTVRLRAAQAAGSSNPAASSVKGHRPRDLFYELLQRRRGTRLKRNIRRHIPDVLDEPLNEVRKVAADLAKCFALAQTAFGGATALTTLYLIGIQQSNRKLALGLGVFQPIRIVTNAARTALRGYPAPERVLGRVFGECVDRIADTKVNL